MAIETLETDTPATGTPAPPVRSRRALLIAALGGVGGLFASRLASADPAAAAAGDPLVIGNTTNTAGTANTSLTTASTGTALLVTQNGTGTALRGSAVGPGSIAGFFTAANGTGISGVTASPNTYGVFGSNDGAAGTGAAIRASGKNNNGLVATTDGATKVALKATNSAMDGTVALFENTSGGTGYNAGPAIRAYTAGGSDANVHPDGGYWDAAGEFAGPTGIIGAATAVDGVGVAGLASGRGVEGVSTIGRGVNGFSTSGPGVYGSSGSGYAVVAAGRVSISQFVDVLAMTAPANPGANTARLFARDNGGKTELCVIFPTGAIQVIKTEA
jgi:hypothetical protein